MTVLIPGETCWRKAHAARAAFLIDIEAYYAAVYAALQQARHSVLLLGWGFDPRTRMFPDGHDGPEDPDEIGRILIDLAEARPELDVRLLIWKSAFPISASQEFFPHRARKRFRGSRVKFRLDDGVPFGACHHQKVLVIDDKLAISGGADICVDRWDTPAHLDDEPRRIMPDHECHAARHEVMMMVDGEAARALGDLFRDRWSRAAKEHLAPPPPTDVDPWPEQIPPHITDTEIAIARTRPAWRRQPLVEEIRRLNLASIASARQVIYLENQYFASPLITEALAARLAEPDGPEVVLVVTGESPSWFDKLSMDRARCNMLWRLKAADIFGRFRAYYPRTPGGQTIIVHSKLTVIDDRLARVGSANLNNRSGGFDTECELSIEGDGAMTRLSIAAFRDRLIGHFLGHTGDSVAKARADFGGLIPAIEALNREGRLAPLEPRKMTAMGEFIAAYHLGDPSDVADSWRVARRRERLYAQARAMARKAIPSQSLPGLQARSKSITSGR
jgi:phosphatidylserine/phosphatidylglycerophosphate/cardiolipin synthase-like enzyme